MLSDDIGDLNRSATHCAVVRFTRGLPLPEYMREF